MRHIPLLALGAALCAQEVRLVRVVGGLNAPLDIQSARDGTNRLFVVQQAGLVRIVENGVVRADPFLDIRSKTRNTGECGLLGMAFPPGFRESQRFYVNYTDPQCRNTIIARYRVGSTAEEVILTQPQPFSNHNGGGLVFGPDGFLYIGLGDGGSAGDPQGNGQNRRTWLGKMLRIDVESGAATYRVPATNPFVGNTEYLPEIWALGLRNPWRYSFDRATGEMWIGDVGQNRAEEIDLQPAGLGGLNYGWRIMEGLSCFASATCNRTGLTLPVLEYTRQQGDVSVTGGYVYRGSRWSGLAGAYVYGDYVTGRIWGLRMVDGVATNRLLIDSPYVISSFGEDESGELYLADHAGGAIYRIEGIVPAPSFAPQSVVNTASLEPGMVAGSLATLIASDIAGVTVAGRDAPVLSRAADRVTFQVPWETSGTTATVRATGPGGGSDGVEVPLRAAQPGIFLADGNAVVVRASDNTLVTSDRPLPGGATAYFYATGLGAVDNTPPTGGTGPVDPLARVRDAVSVTLGGVACDVLFAGLAPDATGIYQVNFVAPTSVPAGGSADLVVAVSGASSRPARVPIQ
jgi:uncharacterized protein (TIGR03437 family)